MEKQAGQPPPLSSTTSDVVPSDQPSLKGNRWRKLKTFADRLLKMDKGQWLEDMRGNLSMVTALISAITFQAALNPPGGVVQTSTEPAGTPIGCNSRVGASDGENKICTGQAVLGLRHSGTYFYFIKFNTFSFVASLSAALLLVSGIPLRHRFPMWFLSITMSASLTSLAVTYLMGVLLVIPDPVFDAALQSFLEFMLIWIGLLGLVILFLIIRFLVWFVKKCRKLYKCLKKKMNSSVPSEINVA